jgi:protocatechuate 3,4-dioxygenase beta subunit
MIRALVPLAAACLLLLSSASFAQPPIGPGRGTAPSPGGPVPGLPTGAPRPGLPPRDNVRAASLTGTASLRGRVLATQGSGGLRRAQVSLTLVDPTQTGQPLRRVTTTDADGRYQFSDLPAGRFTITADKAGYVALQYGQRRPFESGTPVTLSDGEALDRIDFALPRGSVIAVRITDEFGEPVAGVQVQIQRYQWGPDGQRRLTSAGTQTPFATTDDRGEFRAFGLMPGEYVVVASMRALGGVTGSGANDTSEGFSPTFYPGTLSADQAQPITLGIGQEAAIQFGMIASRMGRVSGTVTDAMGQPAVGAQLSMVTVSGNGMSSSSVGTVGQNGAFTISGVAPGEHTLNVTYTRPGAANEFGNLPIVVGGNDLTGLRIALGTGALITGRVVFEGSASRGAGATPRVTAQQSDPRRGLSSFGGPTDPLANGTIDENGNFRLAGQSGRVFLNVSPLTGGWSLKSVTHEGMDVTDTPIDLSDAVTMSDVRITLTDKVTSVSGQVSDARGQPLNEYVVVIQPADQKEPVVAARLIRVARPDTRGRFEARGLRPGRYVATAIESMEQNRQYSPEFQKELRRGAREFTIREGETLPLDLRLTMGL